MGILERHGILAWRYCQAWDITPSTKCMHLHLHFKAIVISELSDGHLSSQSSFLGMVLICPHCNHLVLS